MKKLLLFVSVMLSTSACASGPYYSQPRAQFMYQTPGYYYAPQYYQHPMPQFAPGMQFIMPFYGDRIPSPQGFGHEWREHERHEGYHGGHHRDRD